MPARPRLHAWVRQHAGKFRMSFALAQPLAVMQCRTGRVRRQRGCHLYFARRVTFLPCADMTAAHGDTGFGHGTVEIANRAPAFPSSPCQNPRIGLRSRKCINRPGQIVPNPRQQPHPTGDDREQITRARQAAEALFTPKRQVTERSVSDSVPSADPSARKPRVLRISAVAPVGHEEVEASGGSEQQTTPEIPGSQFARIRALVKCGMTVSQVAEVYRVAVGEIARILRKA